LQSKGLHDDFTQGTNISMVKYNLSILKNSQIKYEKERRKSFQVDLGKGEKSIFETLKNRKRERKTVWRTYQKDTPPYT